MHAGSMWPCLFLVAVLFRGLQAMQGNPQPNAAMLNVWRNRVLDAAEEDPCNVHGLWYTYSQVRAANAQVACGQAWAAFRDLTEPERASCINAQLPKCRGFGAQPHGCSNLIYRCTFMCDTPIQEIRTNGERVTVIKPMKKDIYTIAYTVLDPPGPLRNRRHRPNA